MSRYSSSTRTPSSGQSSNGSLPRTPSSAYRSMASVNIYDGDSYGSNPTYSPIQKFIPLPNVDEQYSPRVRSPLASVQSTVASMSPRSPYGAATVASLHPVLRAGSASSIGWNVTSAPPQFTQTFTAEDAATYPAMRSITVHILFAQGTLPVVVNARAGVQWASYHDVLYAILNALRDEVPGSPGPLAKGTKWNGMVELPAMGAGHFRMKTLSR